MNLYQICVGDGLKFLTKGAAYFYPDQISVASCKFIGTWYIGSESFTEWLLAFLMTERLVAM